MTRPLGEGGGAEQGDGDNMGKWQSRQNRAGTPEQGQPFDLVLGGHLSRQAFEQVVEDAGCGGEVAGNGLGGIGLGGASTWCCPRQY